jgi:O-antigen biosynthesis protein
MAPPKQRLIEWTGERCVPWAPDYEMLYEHLHRYHFAQRYCHGRKVLDLACGEGYGAAILAEVADEVVAVDIDGPTIEHARANYPRENLRFVESSMLERLAFADGPFDVVVCLEAIEHIEEHEELLSSIKATLTPSGIAVVSTPDRVVYSEATEYRNPFHVREVSRDEFCNLLKSRFKHVSMLGQQAVVGSRIDSLADGKGDPEEVVYVAKDGDAWVERGHGPVPYLLAVASDLDELVPESSSLVDLEMRALRVSASVLGEIFAERDLLGAQLAEARDDRSRLEAQHYAHDAQIGALEESIKELVRQAHEERQVAQHAYAELDATRAHLEEQLHVERLTVRELAVAVEAMRTSRGWRILEALRGIRAHGQSIASMLAPRSRRAIEAPQPE